MNKIICGNNLDALAKMERESVYCCITSPPYWTLRDYGEGAEMIFGGDEECEHEWGSQGPARKVNPQLDHDGAGRFGETRGQEAWRSGASKSIDSGQFCVKCGSWRGQFGLEPTPEMYIEHTLEFLRAIWRVLRPDGTVWWNLGDSYASTPTGSMGSKCGLHGAYTSETYTKTIEEQYTKRSRPPIPAGLKPKDLVGIPFRFFLAAQAEGWWMRSVVIWHKTNPMPSSARDRPTTSHEYVFLMSKNARYFYDAEAIREPQSEHTLHCFKDGIRPVNPKRVAHPDEIKPGKTKQAMHNQPWRADVGGRNKRTVWTMATQSFKGAHFACVDADTECLTSDGWKRHHQLRMGDSIASYDLRKQRLGWTLVRDIYRYQVEDQEMVAAKGRGIDFLVTPNHRCVIQRRHSKYGKSELAWRPDVVEAAGLKQSHKVLIAADWRVSGRQERYINLDLAELVGWFVTEGSIGKDTVTLYQSGSANPEYCDDIRTLLKRLGADYSERSRQRPYKERTVECVTWRVTKAVANELLSICQGKKLLPPHFLTWRPLALKRLYDGLMKGDGHFREGGRATFVQKDKSLIDQVQALMVRLGYSTTLRRRSEGTWSLYKTVARTRMLRSETTELLQKQVYSGLVWCPKTRFGTFVARRNGRVFITGNTFPEDLVETPILTTPTKCCAECGAGWERVTGLVERYIGGGSPGVPKDSRGTFAQRQGSSHSDRPGLTQSTNRTLGFRPTCSCLGEPEYEQVDCESCAGTGHRKETDKRCGRCRGKGWRKVLAHNRFGFPDDILKTWPTVPAVVLDPFAGTGTVGQVSERHGRDSILIEIVAKYIPMIKKRLSLTSSKEIKAKKRAKTQAVFVQEALPFESEFEVVHDLDEG